MTSFRPARRLLPWAIVTTLSLLPAGILWLRLEQERATIIDAASAPHQDGIMAAHVPHGGAFAEVVDARRMARLAASRSIGEATGVGAAVIWAADGTGLTSRDATENGKAEAGRIALLPMLFLTIGRGEIAVAPTARVQSTSQPSGTPVDLPTVPPPQQPQPGPIPSQPAAPALSYWRDAMPILSRECAGCHYSGGIAPFPLESYADARSNAELIRWALAENIMPPLPADPTTAKPFDDPRIMSAADRGLLIRWIDEGAVEGDPDSAPPIAPPDREPFGPPNIKVDIGADYSPAVGVTDDYRCFIIDPGFRVDTEITMVDIVPQSAPMFHHGILYLAEPEDLADVRRLDKADAGPGWTCYGGPGFNSDEWTAAEAVGAMTRPYPAGTAKRISAGSVMVLQQHYNTNNGRHSDRTQVHFWKAPRPINKVPRDYRLVNPLFRIPAGAKEARATGYLNIVGTEGTGGLQLWPTARAGWLWRVWGHMHTLGDRFTLDLIRENGVRERLLDIPRWDFNWQGAYDLVDPVRVETGDRVEMGCVWDNSAENQPVVRGVKQQPRDVTWGEGTLDEMCLGGVTITD